MSDKHTTPCPHCGEPISPGALLAKPKRELTEEEREKRRENLAKARANRWKKEGV